MLYLYVASRLIRFFLVLSLTISFYGKADEPFKWSRTITVRDGLPQSYISGLFQDEQGFLWISTLNGLARYDGRELRRFDHNASNPSGLSGNIILQLFNAGHNNIWLWYADGKVDQLNTLTGQVIHLWKKPQFKELNHGHTLFRTLIHNDRGLIWMMAEDGGINEIRQPGYEVRHFTPKQLGLKEPVLGIAVRNGQLLLLSKSYLTICASGSRILKTLPYPFGQLQLFKVGNNFYIPQVRKDGTLVCCDAGGLKIWDINTAAFRTVKLGERPSLGKLLGAFDRSGNLYFEFERGIFILRKDNTLEKWSPAQPLVKGIPTSMLIDRSGVLWIGTNGFGLRQYNLNTTGLPGYDNAYSFVYDVLARNGILSARLNQTFLSKTVSFSNRTATIGKDVWITDIYRTSEDPQLILAEESRVTVKTFRPANSMVKNTRHAITFLAQGQSGTLWGINQRFELLKFNTTRLSYETKGKLKLDSAATINGMVECKDGNFYISSDKGLFQFSISGQQTVNLSRNLPTSDLLHLCTDPSGDQVLWIGTLADGLIRFDTQTRVVKVFNTATGLPNNTIYSILKGNNGQLWCSSNRGIFSFHTPSQVIRSFTSRDGLRDDEFNRYYYMSLPGGKLAFGGPLGFTIFNPSDLQADRFNPKVRLTSIQVINRNVPQWAVGDLRELTLSYDQNFITFVFAALQFDLPEKNQYRYMLKGLDRNWIMTGNENKAAYTSLPPGKYTLLLNATNTGGKWSSAITTLQIRIDPPYWKTWWFLGLVVLTGGAISYALVRNRINSIKRTQRQLMQYEREAIALHALALRARMNPHFIFNCLNSIKALIQEKENEKAVSYLTTFATLIRKQLDNHGNEVTLAEELETCKLYLQLEKMRFGDRISSIFDIDKDEVLLETKIPPLTVQPVLENAIVHGLLPSPAGGTVQIRLYRDQEYGICEIEDNGIGRKQAEDNKLKSSRLHRSKGTSLLAERISLFNKLNRPGSSIETFDLFTPAGKAAGTLVIIKFKLDL